MEKISVRKKFRNLVAAPRFIPALGVWDAYTARAAEFFGMDCVHIGGYQLGAHYVTSEPLLTLTELANTCRYVASAVRIPVVVDAGAGFGEPLHVMRTVRDLEQTGVSCIHIEDQSYPKRASYHKGVEHTISRQEMVEKIKAALAARTDPEFMIMARTDAMKTEGFAEGVARANLYLEAGAEMVMVFPNNLEEARLAPREIKGPVAYTNSEGNNFGRPVFTLREFQDMGYKLATYPAQLLAPATQEMKRIITNIKQNGLTGFPDEKMAAWRREIEAMIGLEEYYRIEAATVER